MFVVRKKEFMAVAAAGNLRGQSQKASVISGRPMQSSSTESWGTTRECSRGVIKACKSKECVCLQWTLQHTLPQPVSHSYRCLPLTLSSACFYLAECCSSLATQPHLSPSSWRHTPLLMKPETCNALLQLSHCCVPASPCLCVRSVFQLAEITHPAQPCASTPPGLLLAGLGPQCRMSKAWWVIPPVANTLEVAHVKYSPKVGATASRIWPGGGSVTRTGDSEHLPASP